MKNIIDTHAHILKAGYRDDLESVINRIKEEGMTVVNIPIGVSTSYEVLELNKQYDFLHPVVGIHPDFINRFKESDLKEIDEMVTDKVVAIGEIGLDYHRKNDEEDKKLQKHIFITQIEIAKKHNLPVVIHVLDAHDDLIEIVKNYPEVKFLFHCWSGSVEHTKTLLETNPNSWFAFGGEITTQQQENHRSWEVPDVMKETILLIPKDKLLFETDCPGLIPDPYRSNGEELNYPWYIIEVFKTSAEILGMDIDELIELGNKNAREFYNI